MSTPLDLQMKVEQWRAKARAGTMTLEDTREAILVLRAGRALVTPATGGSKTNAKARATTKKSADDLLSELDNI